MCQCPKITLVTPSLNAEKTIARTLRSVERQEYPNLQLICVDGKSSDTTLDIIQQFQHIVSLVISEKDKNVSEAVNKGFRRAEGDIYCYLNADDTMEAGALHTVAKMFVENPEVDVITGGCRRVFADGSELITQVPDTYLDVLSMKNGIEQPSTFWRASVHQQCGELDESYFLAFDWEWWNRLYESGARFKCIPDVLSVYYFCEDNLTSQAGSRVIDEIDRVTKRYGPVRGYIADIYRLLFHVFDMHGCYDQPFDQLTRPKRFVFGAALWPLYKIFGRTLIDSYNWNWASKQIRGIVWYK